MVAEMWCRGRCSERYLENMSKVIEQLKDKLADASQKMNQHAPAVADDPMSALDEVEEKESPTKK